MPRILLVDDEAVILTVLQSLFKANGYDVVAEKDGEKALSLISSEDFDLLISDMRMTPVDGMEILAYAKKVHPEMPVLMLTAYGSIDTAEEAMSLGAFGYHLKPFNAKELVLNAQRAIEQKALPEQEAGDEGANQPLGIEGIVAESPEMKEICTRIKEIAPLDVHVLITGEHGTGKSVVARAIHKLSRSKDNACISMNCADLPEPILELEVLGREEGTSLAGTTGKAGILEEAKLGTVLLEEIGWMSQKLQKMLCASFSKRSVRRIKGKKEMPISARLIATADQSLDKLVGDGNFTTELYTLLKSNCIELTPLRDRPADIVPLMLDALRAEGDKGDTSWTLDDEVADLLMSHSWPGNAAEVASVAKKIASGSESNVITKDILSTCLGEK